MTLRLNGSTSGYTEIDAPAVAGSNTLVLPTGNGSAGNILGTDGSGNLSWVNGRMVLETAKASTIGTSIDFTGIPSWVKRVTVMFNGVSLSGTDTYLFQLGTSSGFVTSGYNSGATSVSVSTGNTTGGSATNVTTGITANGWSSTTAGVAYGHVFFTTLGSNQWVATGTLYVSGNLRVVTFGGAINLGGTLDRVRIASETTNTFDLGTINILYEG
jgi:hypothetical protein